MFVDTVPGPLSCRASGVVSCSNAGPAGGFGALWRWHHGGIKAPGVFPVHTAWFSANACGFGHLMDVSGRVGKKGEPWTGTTGSLGAHQDWTELHCLCDLGQPGLSMPPPLTHG